MTNSMNSKASPKRTLRTLSKGIAIAAVALVLCGFGTATPYPDQVQIVTIDVDHFWKAFDDAAKLPQQQRTAVYIKEYFNPGSPALEEFMPRLKGPISLAVYVERHRDFYEKARPLIQNVVGQKAAVAAAFRRLKSVYPDAKFPAHVYLVVGRANSGGISTGDGIVLGAEMFATPPGMAYSYAGLMPDMLPFYAVHEAVHFNQAASSGGGSTLLQKVIAEGTADFVASLVLPEPTERQYADRWQYGCANEAALAARLLKDQDLRNFQPWMYSFKPAIAWPPDMGYWIGYRIDQAYYAKAKDKTAALRAMLAVKDSKGYLKSSRYPAAASPCAPEKLSNRSAIIGG